MSNKLIAYFSAEGTTQQKATILAEATGADIYEIKPEVPYSKSDVNWRNPLARCNREWIKKSKIALADKNANIADYDEIYLAFPIWYFTAPLVIKSFLEEYDFSGKKIVVFATSGGSDFKKAIEAVKEWSGCEQVVEGRMLNGVASAHELSEFAE